MNIRQRWLAFALFVTVAAAFWPDREENDSVVEPVAKSARLPSDDNPAVGGEVVRESAAAMHERLAGMQENLFPRQTWVPPPPPPKPYVAPPPPPPQVPPLPFKYLGRWVEGGQLTLFLVQGEQPISIHEGQVLSGSWRVDEITDRTIVFTYLPLNMQSILGISP